MCFLVLSHFTVEFYYKHYKNKNIPFFWARSKNERKFHLASWEQICLPKTMGGWSIKNLSDFNTALCPQSMWRGLFDKGLWILAMKTKYLRNCFVNSWFRFLEFDQKGVSIIWNR